MNRKAKITAITAVTALSAVFGSLTVGAENYQQHTTMYSGDYSLSCDVQIGSDSIVHGGEPWEIIFSADGTPCYSLEAGKSAVSSVTRNGYSVYKQSDMELSPVQRSQLRAVLLYSYTQPPDSFGSARYIDFDEFAPKYIATQLLIWEVVNGQRESYYHFCDDWMTYRRDFEYRSNGYTAVSEILDSFKNKSKGDKVRKCYEEYENAIRLDNKRITFATDKETVLTDNSVNGKYEFIDFKNTLNLINSHNGNSGEYTFFDNAHHSVKPYSAEMYLTDMNNVLDEFDVEVTNGNITGRSQGRLSVYADLGGTAEIKFTHKDTDRCRPLILDGEKASEGAIVYPMEEKREYFVYAEGAKPLAPAIAVTILGDADNNGSVGISDIIAISKYNANPKSYPLSLQEFVNADVNHDNKVDSLDLSRLLEYNLRNIKSLD